MHEYMCNYVLVAHFNELQCDEKRESERGDRERGVLGSCVDSTSASLAVPYQNVLDFRVSPQHVAPHGAGMQ